MYITTSNKITLTIETQYGTMKSDIPLPIKELQDQGIDFIAPIIHQYYLLHLANKKIPQYEIDGIIRGLRTQIVNTLNKLLEHDKLS